MDHKVNDRYLPKRKTEEDLRQETQRRGRGNLTIEAEIELMQPHSPQMATAAGAGRGKE